MLDNATKHATPDELDALRKAIWRPGIEAKEYLAAHSEVRAQARKTALEYVRVAANSTVLIELLRMAVEAARNEERPLMEAILILIDGCDPDDFAANVDDAQTAIDDFANART